MRDPIIIEPLTRAAFAPYGQVIETAGAHGIAINDGACVRYHDLATIEVGGDDGRPLVNIFVSAPRSVPLTLAMVERHPLGSQAFIPLSARPFLVITCDDDHGVPVHPRAFVTQGQQGINLARNVWHGVLTPLYEESRFIVIDRGGPGQNLQEHRFAAPYTIIHARASR